MNIMSPKFSLAALAALSLLLSCQREELTPDYDTHDGAVLTFFSENLPETKTEWDGATVLWSAGDKISVGYTLGGRWSDELFESDALTASALKARFSVQTDLAGTESGTMQFYGIYPSSAVAAGFADAPAVTVNVPSQQTVSGPTFDRMADVMIAKSLGEYDKVPSDFVPLLWTRLVSHLDITLSNIALSEGETLVSLVLTADGQASMAGEFSVDLLTGEVEKGASSSNSVTVDVSALSVDESGSLDVWAAFMPCRWESLKVELVTSERKYIRNINSCSLEFAANRRHTLEVDMSSAFGEEINAEVFELLNLDYPGLEQVKSHYQIGRASCRERV